MKNKAKIEFENRLNSLKEEIEAAKAAGPMPFENAFLIVVKSIGALIEYKEAIRPRTHFKSGGYVNIETGSEHIVPKELLK